MEGEGECMCAGRGEKASVSYGLFYLCLLSLICPHCARTRG
jgi:hypothetical protein